MGGVISISGLFGFRCGLLFLHLIPDLLERLRLSEPLLFGSHSVVPLYFRSSHQQPPRLDRALALVEAVLRRQGQLQR
jgi:hypothetical protein